MNQSIFKQTKLFYNLALSSGSSSCSEILSCITIVNLLGNFVVVIKNPKKEKNRTINLYNFKLRGALDKFIVNQNLIHEQQPDTEDLDDT